jgi:Mn2+/Fe2+ NRAMP family transporter
MILQELTGRIGIVTGKDLSQLISSQQSGKLVKFFSTALVLTAIGVGNAAYESGNIAGTYLGLQIFYEFPVYNLGRLEIVLGNLLIGLLAFTLLWMGNYKLLERILILLVVLMSLAFLATTVLIQPDWKLVLKGFIPQWQSDQFTTIVALIGTTVVPYNLFLYSSLAKAKWSSTEDLRYMRSDIVLAILLGGLVSMAIVIVGAANTSTDISSALDLSGGMESLFGRGAKYLVAFGLLAAGLTSSLTAPLAAGLVICGIMGWSQSINSRSMRGSIAVIVGLGIVFSSLGIKSIELIMLAQLANGILLPVVSGWIIWVASQKDVLGKYTNSPAYTFVGILIWLFTLALGMKSIFTVFGISF